MEKPLKINQKSMPERDWKKGCQNDGKRSQKGAKMEPEIRSKWPQGAKGEPKGRPKGRKGRKKGRKKGRMKRGRKKKKFWRGHGPVMRNARALPEIQMQVENWIGQ